MCNMVDLNSMLKLETYMVKMQKYIYIFTFNTYLIFFVTLWLRSITTKIIIVARIVYLVFIINNQITPLCNDIKYSFLVTADLITKIFKSYISNQSGYLLK